MLKDFVVGFSLGIIFTVAISFSLKENTVIYRDGYAQCMVDKENRINE
jgi:hypothetical protein